MNKSVIFVIFVLILGIFIGVYFGNSSIFTGRVIAENSYTYTTAVCSQDNECLDLVVGCENGRVTSIEPLIFIIKHPANWTDIRGNVTSFC